MNTNKILKTSFKYRDNLDFKYNFKFGTEIEFISPTSSKLINKFTNKYNCNNNDIKDYSKYNISIDASHYDFEQSYKPIEISTPILYTNNDTSNILNDIYMFLINNKSCVNLRCGNHYHFSLDILKNNFTYYNNILKLISAYEHIIYKFGSAELSYLRKNIDIHSNSIKSNTQRNSIDEIKNYYNSKRYGVRFTPYDTIEIRYLFQSLNPYITQNNLYFIYKLFEYAISNKYDNELIENRLKNKSNDYIEDAKELSNILFDDKLDKLYFLKQVLKLYNKDDLKMSRIHNINIKQYIYK